jgi:hypothetical protein
MSLLNLFAKVVSVDTKNPYILLDKNQPRHFLIIRYPITNTHLSSSTFFSGSLLPQLSLSLSLSLSHANKRTDHRVISTNDHLFTFVILFHSACIILFLDTITHTEDFSCDLIVKFKQIKKTRVRSSKCKSYSHFTIHFFFFTIDIKIKFFFFLNFRLF